MSRYNYTLGSYFIIEKVMSFANISKLGMVSLNWFLMWTCHLFVQLVGRLSQEELMSHLPSFLPSLFDAFGNQSADVRKVKITVFLFFQLLCLVRKPERSSRTKDNSVIIHLLHILVRKGSRK